MPDVKGHTLQTTFDLDAIDAKEIEAAAANLLKGGASSTVSTSTSTSQSSSRGSRISITEQINRRFFEVPTPEEFLDNFEVAFGGFLSDMRDSGLNPGDIGLALDPATGLMDLLLDEYMGGLAQRAAAGEDIFSIVGTEEDFKLLRTEPGTESIEKGTSESTTKGSSSSSGGSSTKSPTEAEGGRAFDFGPQEPGSGTPGEKETSTSKQSGSSTSQSDSKDTSLSTFKSVTQVLSAPKIAAVFSFSPGSFLEERFHGDAGELATFIASRKGERQRGRQTITGAPVVTARRT